MTTIVTAFISNINNNFKPLEKYFENGEKLININIPKIIFIEKKFLNKFKMFENTHTIFIPFEKKELFLFNYINKLSDIQLPCVIHLKKDTLEYFSVQLNKTEWIKKAIEINPYKTSQFIWIDFGINHIIKNSEILKEVVLNCQKKIYNKVRIASIWDLDYTVTLESQIKNKPFWFFAGGVFGGNKNKLIEFANKVKIKIEEIIKKKYIMWEVNVWYLVYKENKDLFDCYKSDHNLSILSNY